MSSTEAGPTGTIVGVATTGTPGDDTASPTKSLGTDDTVAPAGAEAPTLALGLDAAPVGPAVTGDGLAIIGPAAYEIGGELARGGMGRIVRARDRRLDRPVAIKELLLRSESYRARFEREARITARLQHPAIVPIYEAGAWPSGEPFYAMKLVDGQPLEAVIADTETLADRLALLPRMTAVTEALAYAHEQRVIHRDLKPHNVLVGAFGEIVVIDWGLAKDLTTAEVVDDGPYRTATDASQTVAGAVMGTAAYMPPEQASAETVDERADVYSLGAMLYQLLSKRRPYDKHHPSVVLSSVIAGPPEPLREIEPGLPPDLLAIVEKAMARDPDDRYRNAGELAVDLKAFTTGQLVAVHRYSLGELVRRWIKKHRTAVAVAAVALAVLVAGGAIAVWRILDANAEARAERDDANTQRATAETQRQTAEQTAGSLLLEQGRQERLAGQTDRAHALLAAAYRVNPSRTAQILLGQVNADLAQRGPRIELREPATDAVVVPGDRARILARLSSGKTVAFELDTGASIPTKITGEWLAASPSRSYLLTRSGDAFRLWKLDDETSYAGPASEYATVATAVGDNGGYVVAQGAQLQAWSPSGPRRTVQLPDVPDKVACDGTCSMVAVAFYGKVVFVTVDDGVQRVLEDEGKLIELTLTGDGKAFIAVMYYTSRHTHEIVEGDPRRPSEQRRQVRMLPGALEMAVIDRFTGGVLFKPKEGSPEVNRGAPVPLLASSAISRAEFAAGTLVTAHDDFTVHVWADTDLVATLTGLDSTVDVLALEPRPYGRPLGRIVAVGRNAIQSWRVAGHTILTAPTNGERTHHGLPYRPLLQNDERLLDASRDGALVLACADRGTCHDVELRDRERNVLARHPGLPRPSWIATSEWLASGSQDADTELRPARGGAMRTLVGCRAREPEQLWLSNDASRGICADETGVAVWTGGGSPRHLHDCPSAARVTSHADGLVTVACGDDSALVDTRTGALVPLPPGFAKGVQVVLSEDASRLVSLDGGRVSISQRTGAFVAQFGRSIRAIAERNGIVYSLDRDGVVAVWDRDAGTQLVQWRGKSSSVPYRLDVSPDGLTVMATGDGQLEEWKLDLEKRSPEELASALAKNPWVVDRGRLIRRPN